MESPMIKKRIAVLILAVASVVVAHGVKAQTVATHRGNWAVVMAASGQAIDNLLFVGTGREIVILTVCIEGVPAGTSVNLASAWVGVRLNGSLVPNGVLKNQPIYPICTTFRINPAVNATIDITATPVTPVPAGTFYGRPAHGSFTISVIPI